MTAKEQFEFSPIESRTFDIAMQYAKVRQEYYDECYTPLKTSSDPRTSRHWKTFLKLAKLEQSNRDIFPDIELFIRAQFEKEYDKGFRAEKVLPFHLLGKRALFRYQSYIKDLLVLANNLGGNNVLPAKTPTKLLIKALGSTCVLLTKIWMNHKSGDKVDWLELFGLKSRLGTSIVEWYIECGLVSKHFLAISKSFNTWVEKDLNKRSKFV